MGILTAAAVAALAFAYRPYFFAPIRIPAMIPVDVAGS